jgi:hypothetical protein
MGLLPVEILITPFNRMLTGLCKTILFPLGSVKLANKIRELHAILSQIKCLLQIISKKIQILSIFCDIRSKK